MRTCTEGEYNEILSRKLANWAATYALAAFEELCHATGQLNALLTQPFWLTRVAHTQGVMELFRRLYVSRDAEEVERDLVPWFEGGGPATMRAGRTAFFVWLAGHVVADGGVRELAWSEC